MRETDQMPASRRRFLQFLAGSPLVALTGLSYAAQTKPVKPKPVSAAAAPAAAANVIKSPAEALCVMDFEAVARRTVPVAHYGYIATGVEGDATVRANIEGFTRYQIRARQLMDLSSIDTSIDLLGTKMGYPLLLCPAGSQRGFHPDGEIAAAKAAAKTKTPFILSTVASTTIEDVSAAAGQPVWFQLYAPTGWGNTMKMVKRVEKAGCPVLVLTVDGAAGGARDTLERAKRADKRQCSMCHPGARGSARPKPMLSGLDDKDTAGPNLGSELWEFVRRLRDSTSMKLVLKGIVAREDAQLAIENGVAGIIVSNHGGRVAETLRPSIDSLAEVVEAVGGKIPIIFDGGIRRGTDAYKGLALGANAVGIARPYLYGLGAFGQEGVEAVISILHREIRTTMAQVGATSVAKISRNSLVDRYRLG